MSTDLDRKLCQALCDLPQRHQNRYTSSAEHELLDNLFRSLTNDRSDYFKWLFPRGFPPSYKLQDAQGAQEDVEYTAAAKGHPCGHIFQHGEASYHCMTCADDATCVLCARCFDSSDHEGHQFHISPSAGNSGCCDCGDAEAWKRPVNCAIHTATDQADPDEPPVSLLPVDLQISIRTTISRVLDYFCDVISCSPENLRVPKTVETIKHDENYSRLGEKYYSGRLESESDPEYCMILWNDEKHTVPEVREQVSRACKERKAFGASKAKEAHLIGRTVVSHSRDISKLIKQAQIIEQIKLTVTIRSSRDTFREQMCGTLVDWLSDIAGCSVRDDNHILRTIICEEMLQQWRVGSEAYNAKVGRSGIDNHGIEPPRVLRLTNVSQRTQFLINLGIYNDEDDNEEDMVDIDDQEEADAEAEEADDDDDEDQDMDEGGFEQGDNEWVDGAPAQNDQLANMTAPEVIEALIQPMDTNAADGFIDVGEYVTVEEPAPPPPPLQPHLARQDVEMSSSAIEASENLQLIEGSTRNFQNVPRTPGQASSRADAILPNHWAVLPTEFSLNSAHGPAYEDLMKNIRLDSMILFDLRLWKQTRIQLRDLYISTVVNVPRFKRILGLRFAGLYTTLSQLYLVADREPDHSIMNLSLQMLTTPSITKEVIERRNFLTNLMAILYTFLTTRQVGFPTDVDNNATLAFETGTVANRRLIHFFTDLRWYLASPFVQERVRKDKQYLLQYLDLAKLSQGICPNVRAVGEHVEYETDAWINASLLTREINKLCRQFAEAFHDNRGKQKADPECTVEAIFQTACVTITNSIGLERKRFDQSEIKALAKFKIVQPYVFESSSGGYRVIDYVVEKGALSFHHALHYALSWLLEFGNDSSDAIEALLEAARQTVKGLSDSRLKSIFLTGEDALLSLFDYSLRVCAWLAQMKAGMWVRNGLSLRHQMYQYKNVAYRDVGHHRDLVLLQTALVACDSSRILASMIDRFGMEQWVRGDYRSTTDCDHGQMLDIVEDFVFLLINLLSDRDALIPPDDEPGHQVLAIRKDIIHTLCFKSLTFSDLTARLTERIQDQQQFQDVLDSLTTYRPPEGLHDSGSFELRPEFLSELDPYNTHFNKNQRDEAESIYKAWMAKRTNKAAEDVVLEPVLRPIQFGCYSPLSMVTGKPLFAQIIHACLDYARNAKVAAPEVPATRIEAFLQIALHLTLIATLEDQSDESSKSDNPTESFILNALSLSRGLTSEAPTTIVAALHHLALMDEFATCRSKIKHILRLFVRRREKEFNQAAAGLDSPFGRLDTASPAILESELEAKKQQALERKAKVMAQFQQQQQSFMDRQGMVDWGEDELVDSEPDLPTSTDVRVWKLPTGVCIHCREETNDSQLYGTFATITESHTLRQTDLKDSDYVHECLQMPSSLDALGIKRPYGVSGANREMIPRLTSDGKEVLVQRQGLGKGWPLGHTMAGLVSTSCGHIMHYACFKNYCHSITRRQSHQIARNHSERQSQKEFVCPLCKALGNAFLPIVWKSVDQSYPATLAYEESLEDFLNKELPSTVHRLEDDAIEGAMLAQEIDSAKSPSVDSDQLNMSVTAWARLGETLQATSQDAIKPARETNGAINLTHLQLRILSNTVSAAEIGHRGQESEYGSTYLSRIPQQTITHLRIMASTVDCHAARSALTGHSQTSESTNIGAVGPATRAIVHHCLSELFPKSVYSWPSSNGNSARRPLLLSDPFRSLSDTTLTVCRIPGFNLHHMLQLYYTAEIVRVITAYMLECSGLEGVLDGIGPRDTSDLSKPLPTSNLRSLTGTMDWIRAQLQTASDHSPGNPDEVECLSPATISQTGLNAIFKLVSAHALTFLRKSVLLFHVAHGVDFPQVGENEAGLSELDRLSHLLRLPDITQILDYLSEFSFAPELNNLAANWLQDLMGFSSDENRLADIAQRPRIPLLHPAPLELIGLPKYFDVLMDESHRRRCPTTGKESNDPALCLFCGEIFCGQAYCCMKDGQRGGCNRHLEKCSYPIGMFLFIRKCQVALLHVVTTPNGTVDSHGHDLSRWKCNGSFFPAPYLTKHGETDSGLRSKYQLILNQKRYDKLLRDAWLMTNAGSTIWSAIARKLEGEVNAGGWESL